MFNWNVDEERFKKEDPEGYKLWRLVQLINYGLDEKEKLDKNELKQVWPKIKEEIDPYKRRFFEYLLWDRLYSLPDNVHFWNWHKHTKR